MKHRDHKLRRVVQAVMQQPWAIEEGALATIVDVLQLRRDGYAFTDAEIQARVAEARGGRSSEDDDAPGWKLINGVAVLPVQGILAPRMNMFMQYSGGTSTQQLVQWFGEALQDPKVRAIVLDVDSPGGTAVGNEEVAQVIRSARGQKPIKAVATNMMASAAYYIGSAADEIIASPSAEIGSIGTYMIHGESSRADANAGYTYSVIKAGTKKAVGNDVEPLTAQSRAVLQERIDAMNAQFVGAVAANRRVTPAHVEERYGQGTVFLAPKAVAQGMADRIGTLDQVVAELAAKDGGKGTEKPARRASTLRNEEAAVDPRLKAWLVGLNLIAEDASDATAQAVLSGVFAGRGTRMPVTVDAILAALKPVKPAKEAEDDDEEPAKPKGKTRQVEDEGANDKPFSAKEKERLLQEERSRIDDLNARGELLGIDKELVQKAIDGGQSVQDALVEWTSQLAVKRPPVGRIDPSKSGDEKFAAGALDALCLRTGVKVATPTPAGHELRNRSLLQLAEMCIQKTGGRVPDDPDEVAAMALRGSGRDTVLRGGVMAAGYNRPGDFPNLMAALAGKMIQEAMEYSPATFKEWCHQIPSAPDFKPRTIVALGEFGEFDRIPDGGEFPDGTIAEEASFIAVDDFGREFSLTPRALVDDDLGGFSDAMNDAPIAHDMTLNRLAVGLLTGNAVAGDGKALFHADHANIVGAPDVPSVASLKAMRLLLRKQTGVSAKRKLNYTLKMLLAPEDMETELQQLLLVSMGVVPTTDGTANPFRGAVKWVIEPQLADHSDKYYYGFADPRIGKALVYCYQKGFEGMKVRVYYDPKTNSLVYQFEGRFAAAVRNWRAVCQNPDT